MGKVKSIASGSFIIFQVFGHIPWYSLNSSKTGRVVSFSLMWILTEKTFEQYCLHWSQDRMMQSSVSLSKFILWPKILFLQLCSKKKKKKYIAVWVRSWILVPGLNQSKITKVPHWTARANMHFWMINITHRDIFGFCLSF